MLKDQLEVKELELSKTDDIGGLYSVAMLTQENVWVCGRVFSENAGGGGGKLNEHNVSIQGSYLFSNSQSIQLNLANCNEYSLFPGQVNQFLNIRGFIRTIKTWTYLKRYSEIFKLKQRKFVRNKNSISYD